MKINLREFELIIINSSAGKDSLVTIWEVNRLAELCDYPKERIFVSHQDLGEMEWPGTFELAKKQAALFGFTFVHGKRNDKNGYQETLLEYAERRGKFPSPTNRWCTSDFKRAVGDKIVRKLSKQYVADIIPNTIYKVLNVFGFRSQESDARAKRNPFELNTRLTTKLRKVFNWLPVFKMKELFVWLIIIAEKLPYHYAYDRNMRRLSCCFCFFATKDDLVISGIENPKLLDKYIASEDKIGFKFKSDLSLSEVKQAIDEGYQPKHGTNFKM